MKRSQKHKREHITAVLGDLCALKTQKAKKENKTKKLSEGVNFPLKKKDVELGVRASYTVSLPEPNFPSVKWC